MVAAHKKFSMPEDKELYLPVLVGAVRNFKSGIDFQPDDVGANISDKNPNYNELTALYWGWKNLKDVDAIGLAHYRRFLSLSRRRELSKILTKEQVDLLLGDAPIILPRKRNYLIETNYSHYIHAHSKEPLDLTRKIIKKIMPEYVDSFDSVMQARSAHMFNMFIMKKSYYDDYCKWLFSILFRLEEELDMSKLKGQEARVFGLISELLLDVWLKKNSVLFREVHWIQIGDRKIMQKAYNFLKRKLFPHTGKVHF